MIVIQIRIANGTIFHGHRWLRSGMKWWSQCSPMIHQKMAFFELLIISFAFIFSVAGFMKFVYSFYDHIIPDFKSNPVVPGVWIIVRYRFRSISYPGCHWRMHCRLHSCLPTRSFPPISWNSCRYRTDWKVPSLCCQVRMLFFYQTSRWSEILFLNDIMWFHPSWDVFHSSSGDPASINCSIIRRAVYILSLFLVCSHKWYCQFTFTPCPLNQ